MYRVILLLVLTIPFWAISTAEAALIDVIYEGDLLSGQLDDGSSVINLAGLAFQATITLPDTLVADGIGVFNVGAVAPIRFQIDGLPTLLLDDNHLEFLSFFNTDAADAITTSGGFVLVSFQDPVGQVDLANQNLQPFAAATLEEFDSVLAIGQTLNGSSVVVVNEDIIFDPATVRAEAVAVPEPNTMFGLAASVAWFIRRRRA